MATLIEKKTDDLYVSYFEEDGMELLRIEKNGDIYHIHNPDTDMTVRVRIIDDYTTCLNCLEHKRRGKDNRFRKTTKLLDSNVSWADYILQKIGFVREVKCRE